MRLIALFLQLFLLVVSFATPAQSPHAFKIAKLKYSGGGDWYANKTSLPNLIAFCNKELNTDIAPEEDVVEPGSREIFNYPFVHMTGHGNVVFSSQEAENLRNYLTAGGFLHIDDNYGMDKYVRIELKKVFPDYALVELPFSHPIYRTKYVFNRGLPKVHEHDNKPPQGFGIFHEGRLVVFYTYECDLGNGWEDRDVYNDPESVRREALKMGANIVTYALTSR